MPVYIAYKVGEENTKHAHWNLTTLKIKLREELGTEWAVCKYSFRWSPAMVCQAIEDPKELEADEGTIYIVTNKGRVQRKNE